MKYFTIQWWSAYDHASDTIAKEYITYIESIFPRLPASLQTLYREVNLHDSHLRTFDFDASVKSLIIELDGWSGHDGPLDIRLSYGDVRSIRSTANPKVGLPGPKGYGDLGYHEIEIIGPDLYEHRMLFSTGIELQIRFSRFSSSSKGEK